MIAAALAAARARDKLALVAYVTAGYPSPARWLTCLHEIVSSGADIVEIGIPFSDPVADGPTIQHASERALALGTTLDGVLAALAAEPVGVPVCLMSYLNPLLALGGERAAVDRLAAAGVAGLVVPDLPVEEAGPWRAATAARGVELVGLVAPTSTASRVRRIAAGADVLYYVAVTGTTGARADLDPDLVPSLERLGRLTDRPLVVGFGIATPDHVRRLRGRCDGVVVGSRIVDALRRGEPVAPLIRQLEHATRREPPCSSS